MIVNYIIPPHPTLKLFIDNYILSTSNGRSVTFKSLWPASNEATFIFHLADQPHNTNNLNESVSLQKHNCLIGVMANFNGVISFNGNYHRFVIQFKPNGFYGIFRRPFSEFANRIFCLDDVLGNPSKNLQEELLNSKDVRKMAWYADKFLLSFLTRQEIQNPVHNGITAISGELSNKTGAFNIAQYAHKANMSIRNFERRFSEQVGVSPKLYHRLARFNNAVITKLKYPQKSWTSIAYECDYFDQMHMIKDFKQFANLNPSRLLHLNTDFTRPRIDLSGSGNETLFRLNASLSKEKFVLIRRDNF